MEKFPIDIKDKEDSNAWKNTIMVDPGRILVYDIETTGLTKHDHITTCSWSIGGQMNYHVFGDDRGKFEEDWHRASGIVTFNGGYFDNKFIERDYGIPIPKRHHDLKRFFRANGRRGGLKKMATAEDVLRPNELEGVGGEFAVTIWKYYQETGDEEALNQLLCYNIWDVMLTAELFKKFVMPALNTNFENPFTADVEKLQQIKDYYEKPSIINN